MADLRTEKLKNGRWKALVSAGIICLFCLACLAGYSWAPPQQLSASAEMSQEDIQAIERARQQMEEISSMAEELAQEQNRVAAEQRDVLGEMKRLSGQISVLEREIKGLDEQIEEKEEHIDILSDSIEVKIEDIEVKTGEVNLRREYLDQRLTQIYRDGEMNILDVLFESTSLTDFLTRFDLLERVVNNDMGLLQDLQKARIELERQKAELELQKEELEAIREELEGEKSIRQAKRGELSQQWGLQNRMSRNLATDMAALESAEDELLALSRQLEKFIADIQEKYKEAYFGSGTMAWPVPGRSVGSQYGMRMHPILRRNRMHSGIDIPAPSGTPVIAADTGRVIMATSYGGYGNTIILDHGGGVSTLYAHLSTIGVSQGDFVVKGDRIGGVGTTGLSTGNHLHFEIRINGATVNPLTDSRYNVSPR